MIMAPVMAIAIFAALLITSPSAFAYAFVGCKWNHTAIKLYVPAPLLSYPAFGSAATSWNGLQAHYVWNGSPADVTGTNEARGNTVAWTGITRTKGTLQTPPPTGGACVNGLYVSGRLEVALNWSVVGGYSAARRQMVAAHELGHVFGLGHVPSNPNVLMYPYDSRTVTTPQADDKAGVNALY